MQSEPRQSEPGSHNPRPSESKQEARSIDLSHDETDTLRTLCQSLVGASYSASYGGSNGSRLSPVIDSLKQRMQTLELQTFPDYLARVNQDSSEFDQFVHCLTYHDTRWFGEPEHFDLLQEAALRFVAQGHHHQRRFRVWSAGCATGEEAYSVALVLASVAEAHPAFTFDVVASDIDRLACEHGRAGVYQRSALAQVPARWQRLLLGQASGLGAGEEPFVVASALRTQVSFYVHSVRVPPPFRGDGFDVIFCRHTLNDFAVSDLKESVLGMVGTLHANGVFVMGQGESLVDKKLPLRSLGHACYAPGLRSHPLLSKASEQDANTSRRLRVLLIDDTAVFCSLACKVLGTVAIDCVSVPSIAAALQSLHQTAEGFDLVLCDVEMPAVNGVEGYRSLRQGYPGPIVMLSSHRRQEIVAKFAAAAGQAHEYLEKRWLMADPQMIAQTLTTIVASHRLRLSTARSLSHS